MSRKTWHEYFMDVAKLVSTRATCDRLHVGAVLVKDRRIIATGYNGSPSGMSHCDDVGHLMVDGHCVSGDTFVSKFQKGNENTGHKTVKELLDMYNHPKKKGPLRNMIIRSVNQDGLIVPDKIIDVWSSGEKDVYLVTSSLGRTVKTTLDHRFLTPDGWEPLSSLSVGKMIGLNGRLLYKDKDWLFQKYINDRLTLDQIALMSGCGRTTISRHLRKFNIPIREFQLGGWNKGLNIRSQPKYKGTDVVHDSSARDRARKIALGNKCMICGSKNDLQVHHVDGNVRNDDKNNLLTLCILCHNLAHTPHAKRERVVFDTITSIKHVGVEEVYDITTKDNHSFVGNGFVLHNCKRTIHGEQNAILQCAKHGIDASGSILYVTHFPCDICAKLIIGCGIREVYYDGEYKNKVAEQIFEEAGIPIVKINTA